MAVRPETEGAVTTRKYWLISISVRVPEDRQRAVVAKIRDILEAEHLEVVAVSASAQESLDELLRGDGL